jgi:agmatine deiminase
MQFAVAASLRRRALDLKVSGTQKGMPYPEAIPRAGAWNEERFGMPLPREDGFYLPAEWMIHSRCWMSWPVRESLWGDGIEDARRAFAEVARSIAAFEPVTMIANPETLAEVSLYCGSGVGCLSMNHDDSWLRDTGPLFLVDGKGSLTGVDWRFNGWGERHMPFDADAAIAENVLNHVGARRYEAPAVLEGGAIHSDGEGTLLASESCLLDPRRNPEMDRAGMERLLRDYLGAEKVIWLSGALEGDDIGGHLDNLACFAAPGRVLVHTADETDTGNHAVARAIIECLQGATDAKDRAIEVVELPSPKRRKGPDGRRLPLSYVSIYLCNGGLIMPVFQDPADELAYEVLETCFPKRKIAQVNALDIFAGGGGIHAITQQQPSSVPVS